MDIDTARCLACDKQIPPKQYLVAMPPPNQTPVPAILHHKKGGLVSGTSRIKVLKIQQQALAAAKAQQPRLRLVIDNTRIPLYCSDACHHTDNSRVFESTPSTSSTNLASSSGSSASPSSSTSSLATPTKQLSSIEKFASAYNFPIPPPPPTCYNEVSPTYTSQKYTNGIMMAGKLISKLCPTQTPLTHMQSEQSLVCRRPPSAGAPPSHPSPLESSELIAKFNDKFAKRCAARMAHSSITSPTPISFSSASTHECPLVPSTAQGRLFVPDVKLKVRTDSSTSLTSMRSSSSRTAPSAPATALVGATGSPCCKSKSSRRIRSPLGDEEDKRLATTLRRPTVKTRPWSYDNVITYPIMQPLPTKIMCKQTRIVDGEEVEEEVEVEVKEERKRLFLFADKVVCKI